VFVHNYGIFKNKNIEYRTPNVKYRSFLCLSLGTNYKIPKKSGIMDKLYLTIFIRNFVEIFENYRIFVSRFSIQ
jgi:hypothetical protein